MIEKVAVSQALRAAFPKDYEGMYTAEEVSNQGYTDEDYSKMGSTGDDGTIDMTPITQEQRKALFRMVHERLGKEDGNALIQAVLTEFGLESTNGMATSTYQQVLARIMEVLNACEPAEGDTEPNPAQSENSAE